MPSGECAAAAMTDPGGYADWLARFQTLAREADMAWVLAADGDAHRPAWQQGLSPDEELQALRDLAEWRGCGCGGGG